MSTWDFDHGFPVPELDEDRGLPRLASSHSTSRDKPSHAPILIIEISLLVQMQRTSVPRNADAEWIAQVLKDMVLYRFNLFWHVARGDFPRGRRFAVPILRVWNAPAHLERKEARMLPCMYEAPLARIEHVVTAVEALCKSKPTPYELSAAEKLWPNYRFSNLVCAERRNLARLNRDLAHLKGQ